MKILEKIKTLYQNFKGLTTIGAATFISNGLGGIILVLHGISTGS